LSATVVTVLGGVIAAAITAVYQSFSIYSARTERRLDREVEARNRRREAYERYLSAFQNSSSLFDSEPFPAPDSEEVVKTVNEYWRAYRGLFHIATDAVLLAASNFHRLAWLHDPDLRAGPFEEEFRERFAAVLIEMRRDVFEQTQLPKTTIENLLPYNYPRVRY